MEVCIFGDKIRCPDILTISGPSTDLCNSSNSNLWDLSMNGCKTYSSEFLSVDGVEISTTTLNSSLGKSDKGSIAGEDDCGDLGNKKSDNSAYEKCHSNHAVFRNAGKPESFIDGISNEAKRQDDDKASGVKCVAKPCDENCSLQSILKPTPQKLKSAIKGSREKQGIAPPKKLTVTWAPDVYDPTPTSVSLSHVPSNKNQHYHNNGKRHRKWSKQKGSGKSSRANKGKDKKQTRKNNGNGSLGKSQPPIHNDILVVSSVHQVSDFNIVSKAEPSCGSSYMKKSIASMHIPATEAK